MNDSPEPETSSTGAPKVSVILPAYNVARFIAEAVASVLAQTFKSYEIIVVNDGSPDTEEMERELAPYMKQITYVKQPRKGIAAACNAALKLAQGKYVAFLDADDVFKPEHLSEQIALLETPPGYDLVYSDATIFGELTSHFDSVMGENPSEGEVTCASLLEGRCNIITTTVVARREPLFEVGMFDESFPSSQDFELWLRLAKRAGTRIGYTRKALAKHRIYPEGLAADDVNSLEVEVRILRKMAQRSDLTTEEKASIERTLPKRQAVVAVWHGKEQLLEGEFSSAIKSFSESRSLTPNWKLGLVILSLKVAPRLLQKIYRSRAA
jgi:glycosyltransferase involved in cell wall biosynthesis